jgi:cyclopropane fatty-acyl-phospholipid synthase-like methyltransferase
LIQATGWSKYSIWEHAESMRELYSRRSEKRETEMTCHAQAAELLREYCAPGDTLLDLGCGSGYFYHSIAGSGLPLEYYGIDAAKCFIEIGQRTLPKFGLPADRLMHMRIEDLDFEVDHAVCINVISNTDNFHKPLERMLLGARKSVILRESFAESSSYAYVRDSFLDPGVNLKVHVNTYAQAEVEAFVQSYGFDTKWVTDIHSNGEPQMVIGYPHHWKFLVARKRSN